MNKRITGEEVSRFYTSRWNRAQGTPENVKVNTERVKTAYSEYVKSAESVLLTKLARDLGMNTEGCGVDEAKRELLEAVQALPGEDAILALEMLKRDK